VREDIETFLASTSESTAKTISARIGMPLEDVAKELHRMHSSGVVEREKRPGKGNEYWYWLTRAEASAADADNEEVAADEGKQMQSGEADDAARKEIERIRDLATLVEELTAERAALQDANARLKSNNAALEQRIDELTLGPIGAKSPLFVTIGRYAKPQRHTSIEKAQKRAAALVRGEKESEVLVLEPVGRMVRGSEWRER
jgi:predicted transcriptional regulator